MKSKSIVDVVIIVEHLNRELDSALLLEFELKKRGLSVAVVFKGWDEGPISARLKPKVIITPWCYDSIDVQSLRGYRGGFDDGSFYIVDLHSEQVTSPDGMEFVLPSGEARRALHLCWGDYFKDVLLGNGIARERIHVVGSNRLDLFRKQYRYLSASKEDIALRYALDPNKVWILIVGNYSFAFKSEEDLAGLAERGVKNAKLNAYIAKETYVAVLDWLRCLVGQDFASNVEFVYRPHPSEPVSNELLEIESYCKTFHINREGAIRDWFLNSSVALMWNSTSSVEAVYADLPVLALRPIPIPNSLQFSLLERIEQISSCEELIHAVKLVSAGSLPPLNREFREAIDYYYRKRNKSATESIADIVEELLSTDGGPFTCSRGPFYRLRKDVAYLVKEGLYWLGVAGRFKRLKILVKDHLTASELQRKRKAINGER